MTTHRSSSTAIAARAALGGTVVSRGGRIPVLYSGAVSNPIPEPSAATACERAGHTSLLARRRSCKLSG